MTRCFALFLAGVTRLPLIWPTISSTGTIFYWSRRWKLTQNQLLRIRRSEQRPSDIGKSCTSSHVQSTENSIHYINRFKPANPYIYLPSHPHLPTFLFLPISYCSHLEHKTFVKRFVSLQFLYLRQVVGLLLLGISRYLYRTTQNKHRPTSMSWSGFEPTIQIFHAGEGISCLRRHSVRDGQNPCK
jgi:hypothetical protein